MPRPGERWAYREKPRTAGGVFLPVEVMKLGPTKSRKVRVRWLDGDYAGMDEWISAARLVVPWDDVDDFVSDEQAVLRLLTSQPNAPDPDTSLAVQTVYFATEDTVSFDVEEHRPIRASVDEFEKVRHDLPVPAEELLQSTGAFVNRKGELHVGQDAALRLAKAICEARPVKVLAYATDEVERARRAAVTGWYQPAWRELEPWRVERDLAERRVSEGEAAEAIVRVWCGAESAASFDELRELRAEIERLQRIVESTADWLRAGHPVKAGLLLRDLKRGPLEQTES